MLASGANAALEHEVELLGLADFIASVGVGDLVFPAKLAKVGARIVVKLLNGVSSCKMGCRSLERRAKGKRDRGREPKATLFVIGACRAK